MYSEFEILENPNKKWYDFYEKIQQVHVNKQNIKQLNKVDTTKYTTYQTFAFPDYDTIHGHHMYCGGCSDIIIDPFWIDEMCREIGTELQILKTQIQRGFQVFIDTM